MSDGATPSPAEAGYKMPAEWAPHTRTWMAWPPDGYLRERGHPAAAAWAAVANAVARFEPVTMLVDPELEAEARGRLDPGIDVVGRVLDDGWMRDFGPSFVVDASGGLGAVAWTFNGWGAQPWARWDHDAAVAPFVATRTGARLFQSRLVNEGGGLCVDGAGTVLVTESVQLDPRRNPGWSRAEVEAELRAQLGVTTVVWLASGLTADMRGYGTNGHIDLLAAFARPGLVLVHRQPDPRHPDHAVMAENLERLSQATDAAGRPFELVEITAPDSDELNDHSYINFSFVNGALVLCLFADTVADAEAMATFARLFPERRLVSVDARPLFAKGGGVHCITQQQPATP